MEIQSRGLLLNIIHFNIDNVTPWHSIYPSCTSVLTIFSPHFPHVFVVISRQLISPMTSMLFPGMPLTCHKEIGNYICLILCPFPYTTMFCLTAVSEESKNKSIWALRRNKPKTSKKEKARIILIGRKYNYVCLILTDSFLLWVGGWLEISHRK